MVIGLEKKSTQNSMNLLSVEPKSQINPTISVIIPTYNNAQFLAEAIDSVLAQQFDALEIIVVDDGSTDHTQSVLQAYAAQVRYLHQENAGSAVARNTALSLARGKYVVFLDADDLLLPGKLHDQEAVLEKRPSLGLVHSGWQIIDESGQILQTVEPWHDMPEFSLDAWVWHKPVKMGAMMFHRSWLEQVGGFDPDLRQAQDVDLLFRLVLAGCSAAWMMRPTFCYRENANSTIRKNASKLNHYFARVLDKFFAHEAVPPHLRAAEKTIRYFSYRWLGWHFFETGHDDSLRLQLQQTVSFSPFTPTETVIDWVVYFASNFQERKRPLSTLSDLWPYFAAEASLNDSWPTLERLLNWWLSHQTTALDKPAAKQVLMDIWPLWQTAVSAGATLAISAESIMNWQQLFHRSVVKHSHRQSVTVTDQLKTLNAAQNRDAAQWILVQQPETYSAREIAAFWDQVSRSEMGLNVAERDVVALLLTLFGQLMLRRQGRSALQTLWLALGKTAVFPRSIVHWVRFVKTAVFYSFQSNSPRSADKNKETVSE